MASDILHIKDSFYFEVPSSLWKSQRTSAKQFYDDYGPWVVRNDPDYQNWEAAQMVEQLKSIVKDPADLDGIVDAWKHWQHSTPARHGRPFDQFLADEMSALQSRSAVWAEQYAPSDTQDPVLAYLDKHRDYPYDWMYQVISDPTANSKWQDLRSEFDTAKTTEAYLELPNTGWDAHKIQAYNKSLSGKIFIPQPFATLRNAYEVQSGFGITRYMLIEIVVALLMFAIFKWLAGKISSGSAPKGKLWNLLESMVEFVRNKIVVPAMGEHDADKYMPLLWTTFFFVLGCNLMGMIPWVGAPTSVVATTAVLALIIFGVGVVMGIKKFGVAGYLKNIAPSLGLPLYLAIFIVPLLWVIEALSLFIKHGVLAFRLLANMVAGHLVLLGIMGLSFGVHAVSMHSGLWTLTAIISLIGATLLSMLELFVAFLQAYVFTFLAAMFIGSATHHH